MGMANMNWKNWIRPSLAASGLSLAMGLSLSTPAHAGGLEVSPTMLQLSATQNADGITVRNAGTAPIQAQARLFAWSQADNADLLSPTTALTVSPPMLQIPAGGQQLLRVIRTGATKADAGEQAFRIIIDELPQPKAAVPTGLDQGKAAPKRTSVGLDFLMRYSLPVFVSTPADVNMADNLIWTLDQTSTPWLVNVRNQGSMRAQIADVQAIPAQGEPVMLATGLLGYVLAGQRMQWKIKPPEKRMPELQTLEAMVNRETVKFDVSKP